MPRGRLDEFHIPPSLFHRLGSIQHGASVLCLITLTLAHTTHDTHTALQRSEGGGFLEGSCGSASFSHAGVLLFVVELLLQAPHLILDSF